MEIICPNQNKKKGGTMTCDEIDDDRYRSLFNLHFSVEMKGSKITGITDM